MIEKIARKVNLLRYSLRISRRCRQPLFATLRRALVLYREKRFLAEEAFAAGLLRLDCDPDLLDHAVSRRYQAQIQRKINPVSWSPLLADKGIFYRYCEARGIPIPELYAIYFRQTPGYCPQGTPLYDPEQWARFISADLPCEFVVKPCDSYCGTGVAGFMRTGPDEFLRSDRVTMTARQIVESLQQAREARSFVIQQRLRSHQAVAALSHNSNLQTVRITTFIGRDMVCRHLFSHLKLMGGPDGFTDNIGDGQTGNVTNVICPETGTIARSFVKTHDGAGDRWLSHHPVTHRELTDFRIPCWSEVCDLARRAAYAFLPVRSVGWDVAVTDEGVKMVEGNIWWDRRFHAGAYLDTIRSDLDGLSPA
jgi:hypothetical protein